MRALLRTTACVAVLTSVVLLVAATASAVTITRAGSMAGIAFGNTISTSNVSTAKDDPYCSGTIFGILGTGFAWEGGIRSVMMGGVPAAYFLVGSDTLMYAMVGPGAKDGPIVVTTGNGTSFSTDSLPGGRLNQGGQGTSPQGLKPGIVVMDCPSKLVVAKPVVTGIKPNPQKGGKRVFLSGSAFTGVTKVTVGGVPAAFAATSETGMVLIVPTTAKNGRLPVVLTNSAGTVTSKVMLVKKA
jgi:hypothetical protein